MNRFPITRFAVAGFAAVMTTSCATDQVTDVDANRISPKRYVCYRASAPITIDGRLDEPAWSNAPWSDAFVDIEGDAKPHPRFETRMKMLRDDDFLYIAARLEEPHVWATLTEHDSVVYHDNDFEVFIDPDGDGRQYYEIEVNAHETIFDLFLHKPYRDGGPADHDWTLEGLRTAVHIEGTLNDPTDEDSGWWVEMAIPWSSLAEYSLKPCPPQAGHVWHFNFSRVQWQHEIIDGRYRRIADTREDNWVWTPQYEINMHAPEHWGYIEFTH